MENALLKYKYDTIVIEANNYLLYYHHKHYKVGRLIYEILSKGKTSGNISELHQSLSESFAYSENELAEIINTKIVPLFRYEAVRPSESITASQQNNNAFWWMKEILGPFTISILARPFVFLFGRIFFPLFFLFAGINVISVLSMDHFIPEVSFSNGGIWQITIIYLALFIIIFLHELGHVAAGLSEKIKPQSIGLGFYLFFPVMFANLTEAWQLKKFGKVKVNLGGIFIQLLLNFIFFSILEFTTNIFVSNLFRQLIFTNTFITLFNLFPLFKYDGYWIISDLMGISSLIKDSNEMVLSLFVKKGPFEMDDHIKLNKLQKRFLIGYTIIRVIFISAITILAFVVIAYFIRKTIHFISLIPYLKLNFATVLEILKRLFSIVLIYFFARKYRRLYSSFKLKKSTI